MRRCATIVGGGRSNATVSLMRIGVRAQTGSGLKVKMRPEVSIKVAGCWASAQGRLESLSLGPWEYYLTAGVTCCLL